jgi:hypothetical protein
MSSPRENPKYSDIDAAVRRLLKIPDQVPHDYWDLVDYLALMGNIIDERGGDLSVPAPFRPATHGMVIKELDELERRASDLANKIDRKGGTKRASAQLATHIRNLHRPTRLALSESAQVIAPYFLEGLPDKLESRENLTSCELRFFAQTAKLANLALMKKRSVTDASSADVLPHSACLRAEAEESTVKGTPHAARAPIDFHWPRMENDVGRPQSRLAHNVAYELARKYLILTGTRPTIIIAGGEKEGTPKGPFLDFIREIFDLLNIKRDALHYARTAIEQLPKK